MQRINWKALIEESQIWYFLRCLATLDERQCFLAPFLDKMFAMQQLDNRQWSVQIEVQAKIEMKANTINAQLCSDTCTCTFFKIDTTCQYQCVTIETMDSAGALLKDDCKTRFDQV